MLFTLPSNIRLVRNAEPLLAAVGYAAIQYVLMANGGHDLNEGRPHDYDEQHRQEK